MLSKHVPLDIPNPYWKGKYCIPALYLDVHYKLQEKILYEIKPIPCNYLDLSMCENFPRCCCRRSALKIAQINSRYNLHYYKLNNSYIAADNFLRMFEEKYFSTVSDENIVSILRKYVRIVQVCQLDTYRIYAERILKELFDLMVQNKIYDGFLWIALFNIEFKCGTPFSNFLISKNCDSLELVLKNVQDCFINSNSLYKYEKFQRNLHVTICEERKSIPLQSILLKYGHEKFLLRHPFFLVRAMDYYCQQCYLLTKYDEYRHLIPTTYTLVRMYLLMQLFYILKKSVEGVDIIEQSALGIWKALPQSYPTGEEIRSVFIAILPNYGRLVERVASHYEEIFPRKDLKPRSLRHYSRCTIRKALNANCMLPNGVEKLNIPAKFASYLNLEY